MEPAAPEQFLILELGTDRLLARVASDVSAEENWRSVKVLGRLYFTRQATTLLRFAKSTSNPELAAILIERAANLKAQIDAVDRPSLSLQAPDVEPEAR